MNTKFRVNVLGALLATLLLTAGSTDSPVADAAERGDVETVVALLRQGADVNAAQGDGLTALHWAAMNNNAEMAGVLLYAGAESEATTRLGGYTPLHLGSRLGHAEVIEALVEQGADVSARTTTGAMPLHLAAGSGDVPAVTTLLQRGAEVDGREGVYEQTPLMWATAQNRIEAMRALLDAGADVLATTKVVDYAELSELDGPERQRRNQVLQARVQADREARAEREAREAAADETAEAAEAEAPAAEDMPAAEEPVEDEAPTVEDEDVDEDENADEDADEDEDSSGSEPEPLGYADLVG
ncbi:MAG: ankyrin repeat domain-containing protein, partial [Gemmatimonadota bacterium]